MRYVKVDRVTGVVLKRKESGDLERDLGKEQVWIELVVEARPVDGVDYDSDTQKVTKSVTQPDLSDLQVPAPANAQRVEGWNIVALDAGELQEVTNRKIAATDNKLARVVEDILVKVTTITPTRPLARGDFNNTVWNKINARRALRGQAPV